MKKLTADNELVVAAAKLTKRPGFRPRYVVQKTTALAVQNLSRPSETKTNKLFSSLIGFNFESRRALAKNFDDIL